jgi:pimeloyl-ACP methyl ester carboxylesterase
MPYAPSDGARLYYEEAGSGYPVIFVHEFSGDYTSWESQIAWFSRHYRCVVFNARGYPPSDVPETDAAYGDRHSADDIVAVMRHLHIKKAHVVGLSMGALAALLFGLRHPGLASALVIAGCGSGSDPATREAFQRDSVARADRLLREGWEAMARETAVAPSRIQLKHKDPNGWEAFQRKLAGHSALGSAMTLRNYQAKRPSVYDLEADLRKLATPTLIITGDEDASCVQPSLYLKRMIPGSGLWVMPTTGHAVNIEEPAAFNAAVQEFFGAVERGSWSRR